MLHRGKGIIVAVAFVGLFACKPKEEPAPPEPAPEPVAAEPVAEPEPAPEDPPDVHIEGDHLTIDTKIMFEFDKDTILADSNEILDHIAATLKNHSEIAVLHIVGHTDVAGGHDHNQDLSERRAAAVVAALRERGVEQTVDSRGVGETEPVCEEDTDDCHEKNRRVEFIVEMKQ